MFPEDSDASPRPRTQVPGYFSDTSGDVICRPLKSPSFEGAVAVHAVERDREDP